MKLFNYSIGVKLQMNFLLTKRRNNRKFHENTVRYGINFQNYSKKYNACNKIHVNGEIRKQIRIFFKDLSIQNMLQSN